MTTKKKMKRMDNKHEGDGEYAEDNADEDDDGEHDGNENKRHRR